MTGDAFILACWNGDAAAVETYLAEGRTLEARSSWSNTGPLLARDPALFDRLLAAGADPSGCDYLGLHAFERRIHQVRRLLDLGVDPDGQILDDPAETAETPLILACSGPDEQTERAELVRLLLAAGADPNRRTRHGPPTDAFWREVHVVGETALHRAAAYCSEAIIDALLAAGADRAIRDARGESVAAWASRHWRPLPLVEKLMAT